LRIVIIPGDAQVPVGIDLLESAKCAVNRRLDEWRLRIISQEFRKRIPFSADRARDPALAFTASRQKGQFVRGIIHQFVGGEPPYEFLKIMTVIKPASSDFVVRELLRPSCRIAALR